MRTLDGLMAFPSILLAIATYERTLVPNQTPWDAFNGGNPNALTPAQVRQLGAIGRLIMTAVNPTGGFLPNAWRSTGCD